MWARRAPGLEARPEICRLWQHRKLQASHLHLDHLDRSSVVAGVRGCAAVLQQQALVAAVVGIAHGGVHAHVRRHARQHDVLDALRVQQELQICTRKCQVIMQRQRSVSRRGRKVSSATLAISTVSRGSQSAGCVAHAVSKHLPGVVVIWHLTSHRRVLAYAHL